MESETGRGREGKREKKARAVAVDRE